ncbi:hypothetical protein GGTG_12653 [Gaeumannomyces tritici R3-111a-1]|uniref:Uncharacterized protein n=1 Tax=Gaeumannomyces tritici (strain R3-111a-1) TaxID=644352 RepID=J3PGM4_GAET3|nr:hypothetical protein GGTG_12653 [Gaeumannomyces tritici R3-111a-1]EJT69770.1 hypothetical protein GGTG_12653 [Gaeumannomyces tritici R3-111a-1]
MRKGNNKGAVCTEAQMFEGVDCRLALPMAGQGGPFNLYPIDEQNVSTTRPGWRRRAYCPPLALETAAGFSSREVPGMTANVGKPIDRLQL